MMQTRFVMKQGLGSILVRSFILKLIYRYGYYKDIEIFIIIVLIDEQLPYKQRSKQFLVDRLINNISNNDGILLI